jgi:hypothetical protein
MRYMESEQYQTKKIGCKEPARGYGPQKYIPTPFIKLLPDHNRKRKIVAVNNEKKLILRAFQFPKNVTATSKKHIGIKTTQL